MMPSMLPTGAADAAPAGAVHGARPHAGAPKDASARGRTHGAHGHHHGDDPFAAFDVTLHDVLRQTNRSDGDANADGGQGQDTDTGREQGLSALWLRVLGRGSDEKPPGAGGDAADDEHTRSESSPTAVEAVAPIVVPQTPQQTIDLGATPVEDLLGDPASPGDTGVDDTTQSSSVPAGTAGCAPEPSAHRGIQARASRATAEGTQQPSAYLVDAAVTDPVESNRTAARKDGADDTASSPASADDESTMSNVAPRADTGSSSEHVERLSTRSPYDRFHAPQLSRLDAAQTQAMADAVNAPSSSNVLGDEANARRGVPRVTPMTPTLATGDGVRIDTTRAEATHRPQASVDATAVPVPAASAVEEQGTGEHHSRERGTSERQASFETVWLKRASTLESRLAPPPAFEAPLASASAVLTAAARTVEQAATPFEMPAPAENLSRLVQSIKVQAKDGLSEANVRLNPEHLGEVTIAVRVDAGTVSAVVRAESADVRQWLRGQEDGIRAALADQGLTLDELVVEQDGQRGREQEQPSDEEQRKARVRARRVSTASFEVSA